MKSLEVPPNACGRVWNAQMRKISRRSAVALKAPSRRWDVGRKGIALTVRGLRAALLRGRGGRHVGWKPRPSGGEVTERSRLARNQGQEV